MVATKVYFKSLFWYELNMSPFILFKRERPATSDLKFRDVNI